MCEPCVCSRLAVPQCCQRGMVAGSRLTGETFTLFQVCERLSERFAQFLSHLLSIHQWTNEFGFTTKQPRRADDKLLAVLPFSCWSGHL